MEDKKIIYYDTPAAATLRTGISGWVSSTGRFWGKDEHMARYEGCTHVICDCGEYTDKKWSKCESCRNKRSNTAYQELPFKEWDRKEAICLWDDEKYFFSEEDLLEYLYENELNGSDVSLVFCDPIPYYPVDYGYWGDDAHVDWEPPKKLIAAVEALNKVIEGLAPHSYTQGKVRTSYEYTFKPE